MGQVLRAEYHLALNVTRTQSRAWLMLVASPERVKTPIYANFWAICVSSRNPPPEAFLKIDKHSGINSFDHSVCDRLDIGRPKWKKE